MPQMVFMSCMPSLSLWPPWLHTGLQCSMLTT